MKYTKKEVEYTLYLYSIAKLHLEEMEHDSLTVANEMHELQINYIYYKYIVKLVDLWTSQLLPDEIEIIELRTRKKKTFDDISITLGYANHSSVIRKYHEIIHKICGMIND